MERLGYAPFKLSQAVTQKNLECRSCRLRHYPRVVADLGYCMKCGNTGFQIKNPENQGIYPVTAFEARY
jgi:ribosomal protein L37AE/L43A